MQPLLMHFITAHFYLCNSISRIKKIKHQICLFHFFKASFNPSIFNHVLLRRPYPAGGADSAGR